MPEVADWEPFAGLVSSVVALITWAPWYGDIFRVNRLAVSVVRTPGRRHPQATLSDRWVGRTISERRDGAESRSRTSGRH
jgi:hypothetical protein